MPIYSSKQQNIAEKMSEDPVSISNWRDWRWHLRNSIQRIETFEKLLGIELKEKKRKKIELTTKKFPLSITPYYLSLIDADDYENDPVFQQAFPSPSELEIGKNDMTDPLAEEKDSPVVGITSVQCTVDTARAREKLVMLILFPTKTRFERASSIFAKHRLFAMFFFPEGIL